MVDYGYFRNSQGLFVGCNSATNSGEAVQSRVNSRRRHSLGARAKPAAAQLATLLIAPGPRVRAAETRDIPSGAMSTNRLLTMLLTTLLLDAATSEYLDKKTTKDACKRRVNNEKQCRAYEGAPFPPLHAL